jgi:hypothetical protein
MSTDELGMVSHFCNPSYLEGINERIAVQASPGKNCMKDQAPVAQEAERISV